MGPKSGAHSKTNSVSLKKNVDLQNFSRTPSTTSVVTEENKYDVDQSDQSFSDEPKEKGHGHKHKKAKVPAEPNPHEPERESFGDRLVRYFNYLYDLAINMPCSWNHSVEYDTGPGKVFLAIMLTLLWIASRSQINFDAKVE